MIVIYSNGHSISLARSSMANCWKWLLQPASSWPCEDALPSLLRPLATMCRMKGSSCLFSGWMVTSQLNCKQTQWYGQLRFRKSKGNHKEFAEMNPPISMNDKNSAERLEAFDPSSSFRSSRAAHGSVLGFPHRLQPCLVLPSNALLADAPGSLDGWCSLGAVGCCSSAILDPTIRKRIPCPRMVDGNH